MLKRFESTGSVRVMPRRDRSLQLRGQSTTERKIAKGVRIVVIEPKSPIARYPVERVFAKLEVGRLRDNVVGGIVDRGLIDPAYYMDVLAATELEAWAKNDFDGELFARNYFEEACVFLIRTWWCTYLFEELLAAGILDENFDAVVYHLVVI